ncbi:hypothetical protein NA78x_001795 [Anatilimnocola sp. NA78]|uniref:hypothetical protein n=1 Tax=Anatilimnocola sp. NA78 TaxID=3415683 RepID=UPI003CE4FE89
MNIDDAIKITVGFLGGSLSWGVIKFVLDAWQSRVPTLRYDLEVNNLFNEQTTDKALQATLITKRDGKEVKFKNLSIVRIALWNSTRVDRKSFAIGVRLDGIAQKIIGFECDKVGRMHECKPSITPSPYSPVEEVDFELAPFNRGDSYVIRVYVDADYMAAKAVDVRVDTNEAVNLIRATQKEPASDRWGKFAALALLACGCIGFVYLTTNLMLYLLGTSQPTIEDIRFESERLRQRIEQFEKRQPKLPDYKAI